MRGLEFTNNVSSTTNIPTSWRHRCSGSIFGIFLTQYPADRLGHLVLCRFARLFDERIVRLTCNVGIVRRHKRQTEQRRAIVVGQNPQTIGGIGSSTKRLYMMSSEKGLPILDVILRILLLHIAFC